MDMLLISSFTYLLFSLTESNIQFQSNNENCDNKCFSRRAMLRGAVLRTENSMCVFGLIA